ncbi:ribonuclease HI [Stieleria varia]|uniref:ribonuclease HI n=1 Tax=Stieleria varia TaxID=2528005 RepID=UPI00313EE1A4
MKLTLPRLSDANKPDAFQYSQEAAEGVQTHASSCDAFDPSPPTATHHRPLMMPVTKQQLQHDGQSEYLLVCEARSTTLSDGAWRFSLETVDGVQVLEAEDQDFGDLNRLTLLAAVRGLEAIEGSSSVTLLSNNRYLIRSLSDSLPRWRQNNFMWEHFGRRIDVQNGDLWRRVDHALSIHRVEACLISSRLVSFGNTVSVDETSQGSSDGLIVRVDNAHNGPSPRRSADRLRRLLMGGSGAGGSVSETAKANASRRRRFTSQDLLNNG